MKFKVILVYILFSFCLAGPMLGDSIKWNELQQGDVWIGWSEESNIQWCRSVATLPFPIESVIEILEDKENYPSIFDRVDKVHVFDNDIIHLMLDMPFPFSGRDYIVKYSMNVDGNDISYAFQATSEIDIPIKASYVRLSRAGGEWYLTPTQNNHTKLTYTWNGELLGDFPNWALSRAWKEQGNEVMDWLTIALEQKR